MDDYVDSGTLITAKLNESDLSQSLKNFKMETFAKTPYFLKSPRSRKSSYGEPPQKVIQSIENNYDDNTNKRPLRNHLNKLSQSSDEIAKAVNIFFENKATILHPLQS